ncbi:hypothetical protein IMG5_172420 [Ichthyophthirius multifiliis]|uniref:Endonuclease V n=1 Tax=Ichthyophthirius multifiliis TaxID=5932 RepID=G0R1R8_ICHMU|nr:hypothetical protein IMG5_172420 [Ichthyophthirius multifiliis]EGR28570.1 hypothetical protein IMG5_172420 [Ichthyophthirius multifiliis]|eukprot:XP_004029806.1 hypothetical protein IMG5_172420 [Ichthyophthirius multifiliis]
MDIDQNIKSKFQKARDEVDPILYQKWDNEQNYIRQLISEKDEFDWDINPQSPKCLKYIGGVDISFSQKYDNIAVAILTILEYTSLKAIYQQHEVVKLDYPYIPGFLAFREAAHLAKLFNQLKQNKPEYTPQVVLVDGNGILHQNACGLASHLGVLINIPTIGIGKTVFFVDGLSEAEVTYKFNEHCKNEKDYVLLQGKSGRIWGAAIKSKKNTTDPIIIQLDIKFLYNRLANQFQLLQFRIPEPVRVADVKSREIVRNLKFEDTLTAKTNDFIKQDCRKVIERENRHINEKFAKQSTTFLERFQNKIKDNKHKLIFFIGVILICQLKFAYEN